MSGPSGVFAAFRMRVRRALVHTIAGRGTYVRARGVTVVPIEAGMRIVAREATDAERRPLEISAGGWVLVVERPRGDFDVLPTDASEIRVDE